MKLRNFIFICMLLLVSTIANAKSILPTIHKDIGDIATRNIEDAERVFCYQVSSLPNDYRGYTLNNTAITGFCGIIDDNLKDLLIEQLMATSSNINFTEKENCTVNPVVLLRFVKGVDSTDVLLSYPCESMTIFYAGGIYTYNLKPASELLNTINEAFQSKQVKFVSPALLNQLLPIGVPQTSSQKAVVNQSSQPQARRGWETSTTNTDKKTTSKWNSINFSK